MKKIKRSTANYKALPFNPRLKQRAKVLRKSGNYAEVLFWEQVKKAQFKGLDFDRQKIIGNYIVDFFCVQTNTVLEIDGDSHIGKEEYDAKRQTYLESLGLNVIRITDKQVKYEMNSLLLFLNNHKAFSEIK